MKKLWIAALALMISTASYAGLVDVYNAIDSTPNASATKVDQKAAALKNKVNNKVSKSVSKANAASDKATAKQEALKAKLESKLADLVKSGQGESSKALEIKSELESINRLINAAKQ